MNLNKIASLLSQPPQADLSFSSVAIDSRLVKPGALFIALRGQRFDGHVFVKEAEASGAVAAVVEHLVAGVTIPQMVVADPLSALAQIADLHRQNMNCSLIALTGSNGKTTVKEMIAAILPPPSHATKGNFNNHIGVPLSVLELNEQHRYAVFELGANHPGEIAHTVSIVRPDVSLINNIAPAHVEGFGSIDGVARAKGEIFQGLAHKGIAIINDDDAYAHFWDDLLADKKVLRFSALHAADIYAEDVCLDAQTLGQFSLITPEGRIAIRLQVPGLHNIRNALAAAACCTALGLSLQDIGQGLNHFRGVKGRMTLLRGKNQALIIDDTYNANLRSVLSGLEVLAQYPGKKIFVFGDMGELGVWAVQHHQEVGLAARALGIERVLTCGTYSKFTSEAFGEGSTHYPNQEALVESLLKDLDAQTSVLVKGSRSSAMEKIVAQLLNEEERV